MCACVCLFQRLQPCSFNWTVGNYRGQTSFICTHSAKYPERLPGGLTDCTCEHTRWAASEYGPIWRLALHNSKSKLNRPSPWCFTEGLVRKPLPLCKVWMDLCCDDATPQEISQFVKHQLNYLTLDSTSIFCCFPIKPLSFYLNWSITLEFKLRDVIMSSGLRNKVEHFNPNLLLIYYHFNIIITNFYITTFYNTKALSTVPYLWYTFQNCNTL